MIFIDTGAFVARYVPGDQYHNAAFAYWNRLAQTNVPCVTSNVVLSETFTLLARKTSYSFATVSIQP
jgi:predicted nucleic acid-binding protein